MPSLRIEVGGQVVFARLTDAPVRVGRDASCDLRIDAPDVSSAHLAIEPLPTGGHKLTDLNTGRPTKVNGLVVKRVSLKNGDRVEVGPARITYLVDAEGAPAPAPAPPAAPARPVAAAPTPRAPEPVRVPEAARAPARAPTVAALSDSATEIPPADAVPAAPPAAAAAALRARSSSGKLKTAILVTAGVAALLLGGAYLVRNQKDGSADLALLKRQLESARLLGATDLDRALAELDRLAQSNVEGIRRNASHEARWLRDQAAAADADFADLARRAPKMTPDRIEHEVARLEQKYVGGVVAKHKGSLEKLEQARIAHLEGRKTRAAAEAEALAAEGRFVDALDRWDRFVGESPGDLSARGLAEDGREAVRAKADERFKALVVEAEAIARKEGPRAASLFLRGKLPGFAGTSSATALALRAAAHDHDAAVAAAALAAAMPAAPPSRLGAGQRPPPTGETPDRPGPTAAAPPSRPPTPSGGAPTAGPATPPPSAPPGLPPPSAENRERLSALLADADAQAAARRFRDALAALGQAAPMAKGTSEEVRVATRREDLDLAAAGKARLVETIKARKERFASFEVAPGYVVAIVDADDDYLHAAVPGGRTKVRWSGLDAPRVLGLVESAGASGKDAESYAALLREAGARDASERVLWSAVEGGADAAKVSARLARWRGEAPPPGGYVSYEGRVVAAAERDRLVFDARVSAAAARVVSKDPRERKAAFEEMAALGDRAKPAFAKALRARREAVVKDVAASKVFTSARTKQKLLDELGKRRVPALALIENETAYPYPYPPGEDHPGQKEVDRLVDLVREVWERPFDVVAQWDKGVEEALAVLREVDEQLGKLEDGYVADLDAVKAAVNAAIDVPGAVMTPADREVLDFVEKVPTSATNQEKENVRIVNRYRIMMGRKPLKLDERLVRGARGHSKEMNKLNYFAHESPVPGRGSPSQRCAKEGYGGGVGENIAFSSGVMNAQAAFDGWFHSSGHHRNMIGKGWTEMGAGRSIRSGGTTYWTQNFGGGGSSLRIPDALPPPRPEVAPEPDPESEPPPAEEGEKEGASEKGDAGKDGKAE
jgi:uncharacterized protein YkwD